MGSMAGQMFSLTASTSSTMNMGPPCVGTDGRKFPSSSIRASRLVLPSLRGAGVRTVSIKDRYLGGELLSVIEKDFGLTEQQVRAALKFENVPVRAA